MLALCAFFSSLGFAGFPHVESLHASPWQLMALPIACWGMVETARCMGKKWNFYHVGVLILLYTELMILAMVLALWAIL